jgi:GTP-binding protein LepA
MISSRLPHHVAKTLRSRAIRYASSETIYEFVRSGEINDIEVCKIRNFSVIAHVDHGKSTLSDAVLKRTGNISDKDRKKGQVLDTLKVERERGITVKAQTASMLYTDERTGEQYLLNLIDTPGHIDFAYEVTRSLSSCQGALLLVDSSQSVQAQTLTNFQKATELGLAIIPVVTKIDLPNANPVDTALSMGTTFGVDPEEVIPTSAKQQIGIKDLLETIVDKLPPPDVAEDAAEKSFRGRIVDSWYDDRRGVICLVQVTEGVLKEGVRITTYASAKEAKDIDSRSDFSVQDVGLLTPAPLRTHRLTAGQVGYVVSGIRSTRQARIGDTMYIPEDFKHKTDDIKPLDGYESGIR